VESSEKSDSLIDSCPMAMKCSERIRIETISGLNFVDPAHGLASGAARLTSIRFVVPVSRRPKA